MAVNKPDLRRIWAAGAPALNVQDPDDVEAGKFNSGWEAEIPPFEFFNFLQQLFTQALAHISERGVAEWDADTEYLGSKSYATGSNGEIYIAVITNTGNDPTTDGGINWITLRDYFIDSLTASEVFYDNTLSGLAADDVQEAIDELVSNFVSPLDFGIGGFSAQSDDWDAITQNGIYTNGSNTAATGIPEATSQWQMIHMGSNSVGNGVQIAKRVTTGSLYIRTRAGSVWTSWVDYTPLGVNQTWQDVTASRSTGVVYTNTTGKPIMVNIVFARGSTTSGGSLTLQVDGLTVSQQAHGGSSASASRHHFVCAVVPNDSTYEASASGGGSASWRELRL